MYHVRISRLLIVLVGCFSPLLQGALVTKKSLNRAAAYQSMLIGQRANQLVQKNPELLKLPQRPMSSGALLRKINHKPFIKHTPLQGAQRDFVVEISIGGILIAEVAGKVAVAVFTAAAIYFFKKSLEKGEKMPLPGEGPGWKKHKGDQGWEDYNGYFWKRDKAGHHREPNHWNVQNKDGNRFGKVTKDGYVFKVYG